MLRLLLCAWLLGASAKKRKHGKGGIPESTTSLTLLLERDFPSLLSSLSSADAHAPQSLPEQAYAGLKLQSYSVEERSAVLAALGPRTRQTQKRLLAAGLGKSRRV